MIEETPAHLPSGERVAEVLLAAAMGHWDRVRPADDSAAGRFLTRVRWLRTVRPDLEFPELDDDVETLRIACAGRKSFADLRAADWMPLFAARLTHRQLQTLDREAPEQITVPSGSRIPLQYQNDKPPILAVRIQEMFGLADTPRIAGGRVKVLLHLLAPNFRPQQVTDDLASFWANTYQVVRKELRVRYPKHAWPEDPWSEPPRRGARPR